MCEKITSPVSVPYRWNFHQFHYLLSLPRVHAQGVKQSVCMSVVVVIGTKITRSRILGIYACCEHNQSLDVSENWFVHASNCSKRLTSAIIVHFLFSIPVVYLPHPLYWHVLMRLRMLKLSVGKGRQVIKQLRVL